MSPGASSPLRGSLDASCGVKLTASCISSTRSGQTPHQTLREGQDLPTGTPAMLRRGVEQHPDFAARIGQVRKGVVRDYADRGGTVLLSSHLIHEIEAIADDLVVIGNGQLVAQGH
jgi:hypothetical protein